MPSIPTRQHKTKLTIFLSMISWAVLAQSTNASLNEDYYHWIDRYEIKTGKVVTELFTSVKPYKRSAIVAFIDSLSKKDQVFQSPSDKFNYEYLRNDSWEWSRANTNESKKPLLKKLYRKKSDFLFLDLPELDLHVNPVFYLGIGKDSRLSGSTFINTRGVEIRGMVDRKVGFYTFLGENQCILPSYVDDALALTDVIPHEGFWKSFKSRGVDFFQARAYIDFNVTRHIYMQFGHDRMFIGNGYRSLIYSDYAPPQLYWRTNVKVWKLNYLFQINRMTADISGSLSGLTAGKYPEKFVAFHHASINIGRKLNLGFFESVIFSPLDTVKGNARNSFELNYFNPVIFYRAMEQQYGSSDNVIVGADFKWNVFRNVSLYGQVVIDEFVLSHVRAGDGWWANKFAFQGGLKYIDVLGVPNLDIQLETNIVRPYTYSHSTSYGSYSNYRQPIAHPYGANFKEFVSIVGYQPIPRLNVVAKAFFVKTGRDENNENRGGDILKNQATHQQDLDNKIAQGTSNDIMFLDVTASYMLRHNFFVDVKQIIRNSQSPSVVFQNNTSFSSLALRWNIAPRNYDF